MRQQIGIILFCALAVWAASVVTAVKLAHRQPVIVTADITGLTRAFTVELATRELGEAEMAAEAITWSTGFIPDDAAGRPAQADHYAARPWRGWHS